MAARCNTRPGRRAPKEKGRAGRQPIGHSDGRRRAGRERGGSDS